LFNLEEGDVYTYEMYTLPEFRRRGIATAIKVGILEYYCKAGYKRFLNLISPRNLASIRNNEKQGYRQVGMLEYWRWGPWRRHVWTWDGRCGEGH
jgi:RimJ/RimL family protein N-acetyltransferase